MIKAVPRLGKILKERGWTQLQLSDKSGVPQGSIARFDSRTRHEASHLFAISRVLDITIEELFEVEE